MMNAEQMALSAGRNFYTRISEVKFLIFLTLMIFPLEPYFQPKREISLKNGRNFCHTPEISVRWQKFLHQNIRNKIPHLFYIHHVTPRTVFRAKMRNFTKNGRNFCHMPEISVRWQKFLSNHIRNKILNIFHNHHFSV